MSAEALGVQYRYAVSNAEYAPDWVYVTAEEDVARAYASRYVDSRGISTPGDVYEVRPDGRLRPDPDYPAFQRSFRKCKRAVITRVVATGVALTPEQRGPLERKFCVWHGADSPIWDEDGIINPSEQMVQNGATREWTEMLRPWLGMGDLDGGGRLTCATPERVGGDQGRVLLDVIPALDRDCRITRTSGGYLCVTCGQSPTDETAAVRHQLGDRVVELLSTVHDLDEEPLKQLAMFAAARSPDRWQWWT